jgi:hypothetical protein
MTMTANAMPIRIQRSRAPGWRMPENTVYVGRPTIFGNPYDAKRYGRELCLALFRETATGCWNPSLIPYNGLRDQWMAWIYDHHCDWLKRIGQHPIEEIRIALKGKNLACWCPLDKACHADILLEIANG